MSEYTVGIHLLRRLRELGIEHVFGVPGDYVLTVIDRIEASPELTWVGSCNELNAAYSADGYARITGAGAFVVTAGVGDLGAAGGMGGSFAERVPVVMISGIPASEATAGKKWIHHSTGDGDFSSFRRMFDEITVDSALVSAVDAVDVIDRLLTSARDQRGPVFLALPDDVVDVPVDRPAGPLPAPHTADSAALSAVLDQVSALAVAASRVVAVVDVGVRQQGLDDELRTFLGATGIPWAATWAAQWHVPDPSGTDFLGVYAGRRSPAVARVDGADLLLRIGLRSDEANTGRAAPDAPRTGVVDIEPDAVVVDGERVAGLPMRDVLAALADRIAVPAGLPVTTAPGKATATFEPVPDTPLTQDRLWQAVQDHLRPGDTLAVDQGTCNLGLRSVQVPAGIRVLEQSSWMAIGWSVPALLGASLADPARRPVVVIGDGALALTVQELSTLLTAAVAPLVLVLNNGGYVIEDAVVGGRRMACNDLWAWRYSDLPGVFDGTGEHRPLGLRVHTEDELAAALAEADKAQADGRLALIEVVLDREDMPKLLRRLNWK